MAFHHTLSRSHLSSVGTAMQSWVQHGNKVYATITQLTPQLFELPGGLNYAMGQAEGRLQRMIERAPE